MRRTVVGLSLLLVGFLTSCAKHTEPAQVKNAQATSSSPAKAAQPGTSASTSTMTPKTHDGVTIFEAVACRSVDNRAPQEAASSFPSSVGRVYVYTKAGVKDGGESSIQHVWYFNDTKMATVTLPVKTDSWRTYSSKEVQPAQKGKWKVEIASSDGSIIETVAFNID